MATWTPPCPTDPSQARGPCEPRTRTILAVAAIAMVFVFATRWPVARTGPVETDEFGFLEQVAAHWFPMHHTLFQTLARALGLLSGDFYRGFIVLDMVSSALAIASAWWWLRALVRPATAAAAAVMLAVGPIFWGYGAIAGNYTAIVLVGSFLLGVARRGQQRPGPWQPVAAAAVLAAGTGYRPDIGLFWTPVFLIILWQHRWKHALLAGVVFALINAAWIGAMIREAGGWERYREATAQFAHSAGARNSFWYLGFVDGPVRYAVKLGMALAWTLGPALVFIPRGMDRVLRLEGGRFLALLLVLSFAPALAFHLLVHFGVPGYSFHYLPAGLALVALGVGRATVVDERPDSARECALATRGDAAVLRLAGLSAVLAAAFWFYPTDYSAAGWRGDFDLAFCRFTRKGLTAMPPRPSPYLWRTANSRTTTERAGM